MKLTDYIVQVLEAFQIDKVFGYIGGSVADLVDSIGKSQRVQFVQSYNEQASSFAANAYAQVTGKTGVAISSSGPGAINLINGIANAYYDSVPCVFITGNVHSLGKRKSVRIRQNAFQETDIVEIVKSITKYSAYIACETDIKWQLEKAFCLAQEGRKGPVLLDIPYDVQRKDIDTGMLQGYLGRQEKEAAIDVRVLEEMLSGAHRPLVLVGGGCQNAKQKLRNHLKRVSLPVVASMRGLDVISHEEPNYIGFIGSYGNHWANLAVRYCDLLIVLGARLDERQMGYDKNAFAPDAQIIQVDIDENELGRKTDNVISLHTSVENYLAAWEETTFGYFCGDWLKLLGEWKKVYAKKLYADPEKEANGIVRQLSAFFDEDAVITSDVGQNQIICAQSLHLRKKNLFLCSAGLGCMGYALPAAVGAYYASCHRQIISINGDGGIMMNLQELQTVKREKIPVKIIVLNNRCLGLIRKLQENLFDESYYASVAGYAAPDFEKLAEAFDLDYWKVEGEGDLSACGSFLQGSRPVLIDVHLPRRMSTLSEPGENIFTQIPRLSDEEYDKLKKRAEEI